MNITDQEIVQALLRRDTVTTRDFFYRKCYPLFKSVYDNYHTDCSSCMEFINEIYIHIMTPDKEKRQCKLEGFRFQSTLFTWIKAVCLFYCYKKYERKTKMPTEHISENYDGEGVRIDIIPGSIELDDSSLQNHDTETILRLMPNRRYSRLIRLRYLCGHTNEETAMLMGMNMNTFYNKHKMAKEQFLKTLRTEEMRHG
ncbi:hypothetical protein [uncultured Prevotella sp.]|uniref:RNA polymerase sigma factor n=1 Tax=uncultured Prevotella sp. TaxID=159272 RepID=UPI00261CABA0|nr:hypothetical protein [uncultured Prevotella sp.]